MSERGRQERLFFVEVPRRSDTWWNSKMAVGSVSSGLCCGVGRCLGFFLTATARYTGDPKVAEHHLLVMSRPTSPLPHPGARCSPVRNSDFHAPEQVLACHFMPLMPEVEVTLVALQIASETNTRRICVSTRVPLSG